MSGAAAVGVTDLAYYGAWALWGGRVALVLGAKWYAAAAVSYVDYQLPAAWQRAAVAAGAAGVAERAARRAAAAPGAVLIRRERVEVTGNAEN